jgi:four helix bundle protein
MPNAELKMGAAMRENDLRDRTKAFALRVMRLVEALPRKDNGRTIANQLSRAGTSVGANYRAACKARSKKEFIAKLGVVAEEADETCYWMELIIESRMMPTKQVQPLLDEAGEILKIIAASRTTAAGRE